MTTKNLLEALEQAKHNVYKLLENSNLLIDFHGLTYRAWEVERLRKEIKNTL